MGEKRNVHILLVGKPKGKKPLERLRHRWIENIRMDLVDRGLGSVDWIGLVQDKDNLRAIVTAVMNLQGSLECWKYIEWPNNLCSFE
jgi:hypothetical protein